MNKLIPLEWMIMGRGEPFDYDKIREYDLSEVVFEVTDDGRVLRGETCLEEGDVIVDHLSLSSEIGPVAFKFQGPEGYRVKLGYYWVRLSDELKARVDDDSDAEDGLSVPPDSPDIVARDPEQGEHETAPDNPVTLQWQRDWHGLMFTVYYQAGEGEPWVRCDDPLATVKRQGPGDTN